jgi:plastocyanin
VRRALLVAAAAAVSIFAVACTSTDDGGKAYREPKGPAQESVSVKGGNYYFEPDPVRLPAGIDEVELVGEGGVHTLVIDGVDGFELRVDGEERDAKLVRLEPGKYTIYCDLPGHRDGGMEATIVVK